MKFESGHKNTRFYFRAFPCHLVEIRIIFKIKLVLAELLSAIFRTILVLVCYPIVIMKKNFSERSISVNGNGFILIKMVFFCRGNLEVDQIKTVINQVRVPLSEKTASFNVRRKRFGFWSVFTNEQ